MRKYIRFIFSFFLLSFPLLAQTNASQNPYIEFAYADTIGLVKIVLADGSEISAQEGLRISTGSLVKTNGSVVELVLKPNGSIIRLSQNTLFKVDSLDGLEGNTSNNFNLVSGKIRMVAAKTVSKPNSYQVRTPTAVGGVRGTDFYMHVQDGKKDWLYVREGEVSFQRLSSLLEQNLTQTGDQIISVKAGEYADTFSPVFRSIPLPPGTFEESLNGMDFTKLNPALVDNAALQNDSSQTENKVASEQTKQEPISTVNSELNTAEKADSGSSGFAPSKEGSAVSSGFSLGDLLSFEVGSITIDSETYAKAIIQSKIEIGKFRIGLFLPIIYQADIFNPQDWYRPQGNNEWSFGTDQRDTLSVAKDLVTDIALKIKFLEFGNQGYDPFFLKFGNLDTLSLGHGSLMRNYSNNLEFPVVRKLGFSTGLQTKKFAFETVVDNVVQPQVVGSRIGLGNAFGIGFTGISDLDAACDWNRDPIENPRLNYGKPFVFGAGVDLSLFAFDFGLLAMRAYTDVGTYFPVFRQSPLVSGNPISTGFDQEGIFEYIQHNWLATAGIKGKILFLVDYTLEMRYEKGLARAALFDTTWNRTRLSYVEKMLNYLDGSTKEDVNASSTMGLYGSAGFSLFNILIFDGSYYWPWALTSSGSISFESDDKLSLSVTIPKGKIPFINLSGSVYYNRVQFAKTLSKSMTNKNDANVHLFDANTTFGGEIVYGLVQGMDLALKVFTSTVTNTDGTILYENDLPMVRPVISIETRVSF